MPVVATVPGDEILDRRQELGRIRIVVAPSQAVGELVAFVRALAIPGRFQGACLAEQQDDLIQALNAVRNAGDVLGAVVRFKCEISLVQTHARIAQERERRGQRGIVAVGPRLDLRDHALRLGRHGRELPTLELVDQRRDLRLPRKCLRIGRRRRQIRPSTTAEREGREGKQQRYGARHGRIVAHTITLTRPQNE